MIQVILRKIRNRFNYYFYKNRKFKSEEEFYTYLFTKDPSWNCPKPNEDESIRLVEIKQVIENLGFESNVDILEVGCGRGWLCNELSKYGTIVGIEPVASVVKYAKGIFPHLEFHAALLDPFINQFPNRKFDLVVSTEVLEHVNDKPLFLQQIKSILKPNGVVVITTPRLEIYDAFVAQYGVEPGQPVEEWLSEKDAEQLIKSAGFSILSHKAFGPIASKSKTDFTTQMWVFKVS